MSNKQNKDDKPKNSEALRALANFTHIGVTMATSVFVGVLIGKYLDRWLGTTPWLLLVFSLLGVGAAIKSLFDISQKK